ncbi:hypothetical protein HC251_11165 [Iamia sp. SCSIO 61187]|uniref:hypothetical protein n=1 Tax=Iamia sp. SCSIO 61187 TaxID=2722752 RepID=UPI001C626F43|nr:hypothetical protein [Iamia sp. SCSIO 61187]QYG92934.1 hypothetical protein HC251_11165 [Iamia sp. SCSIO 61187]
MTDERKDAVEAALDLLVYAPLGFALEARGLLPKFVERGKNQVTMAKMVGQFAVQQGQVEANKRLGPVQEQVEAVLADLGLVPRGTAAPSSSAPPPAPADDRAPSADVAPVVELVPEPEPEADEVPLDPTALAIPDYDSLAASQVVPRLRALEPEELEAVRAYESAGRGRKTILNRITQLQNG